MDCYFHLEAEGKQVKSVTAIHVEHLKNAPDRVPVCQECLEDITRVSLGPTIVAQSEPVFQPIIANLVTQRETWQNRTIAADCFEEARHFASAAVGIEYAIRLLHTFRPEFVGESEGECRCLACAPDGLPRCWQCGSEMSQASRNLSPFCSHECEYEYNKVGE